MGLAFASLNLGGALLQHHRYADAIPHLEEALEHARAVKAEVFLSNALINLGWVYHWLGDLEAARAQLREAAKHAAVPDNRESLGRALEALAAVDVAAGHPELAATLFGAADGVRRSIGAGVWMTDRVSHEQTEAQLRTQLGETVRDSDRPRRSSPSTSSWAHLGRMMSGHGDRPAPLRQVGEDGCMPTPEENMQSVRTFADEVFGNKNLTTQPTGLPTTSSSIKCSRARRPTRRVQSFVSHLLRGITRHDGRDPRHGRGWRQGGDRATYRGTDVGGFIPNMPATGKAFEMEAIYLVRVNDEGQIAEHWGVVDTVGTMAQLGLLPTRACPVTLRLRSIDPRRGAGSCGEHRLPVGSGWPLALPAMAS